MTDLQLEILSIKLPEYAELRPPAYRLYILKPYHGITQTNYVQADYLCYEDETLDSQHK